MTGAHHVSSSPSRSLRRALRGLTGLLMLVAFSGPIALSGETDPGNWELLEYLSEQAPARQIGQPGNAFIDSFVRDRFQEYVEAQRSPGDAAAIESANARYEEAVEAVLASHQDLYLAEVAGFHRDWSEHAPDARAVGVRVIRVIAHPLVLLVVLLGALVLVMLAWWYQRRRGLLYLAGAIVAGAVVALISLQHWGAGHPARERVLAAEARFSAAAEALLAAGEARREAERGQWRRGRVAHNTAAFVPGEAHLHTSRGTARLYQLAPNLVEPANLPRSEFQGRIVYAATGDFPTLHQLDLEGAAVVLEFSSGDRWVTAVEAGAETVIFLEPAGRDEMSTHEAVQKLSNTPLSIPRFYLPRSEVEPLFGSEWEATLQTGEPVHIQQEAGRWERLPVHADWLFIPAAGPMEELVHIQTYKDAASIVPELSPGAESAINLVAVLDLVESFKREPPSRPVLVTVVNDHTNALTGEYQFASHALTPGELFAEELERLDYLRTQRLLVAHIFGLEPSEPLLDYLRGAIERVAGRSYTVKEPVVNHLMKARNTLRGEQNLIEFRLENESLSASEESELRKRTVELAEEARESIKLLGLFNRFGHQTFYHELDDSDHRNLRDLFNQLSEEARHEAELLDKERRLIWENLAFRNRLADPDAVREPDEIKSIPALAATAFPVLPSLAAFNLDIGAGNDDLGFFYEGRIRTAAVSSLAALRNHMDQRSRRLARLTLTVADEWADETGAANPLRSTILGAGGFPWDSHLSVRRPFGSLAFHQFAETALTLSSVEDQHPFIFTPHDTLDQLDRARVERSLAFSRGFFQRIINDKRLIETIQRRGSSVPFTVELTVRMMDRFSVEIPRTVLPGAVVLAYPNHGAETASRHHAGQVRIFPVLMADEAGRLAPRGNLWRHASLLAFGFDSDFRRMTAALDFEENERRFASTLSITDGTRFAHRSIVTFEALKSDVFGLTHPRTLLPLERIEVLDGRNDTRPRHFSLAGVQVAGGERSIREKRIPRAFDGTASIFMTPGLPYKLRSGTVIAIGSTPDYLDGLGFPIEARTLRGLPLTMTEDYQLLSRSRLDLLAARGVASDATEAFTEDAAEALAAVREIDSPSRSMLVTDVARGLAFQAYESAVATINDLVRAVVVLLALVVPFCFFLVKLLSPYTDVNRQLMLFMGVFALCTLLLYFIQPAFHVGDRPEIIILAFIILGLATFVSSVILTKFNAAMTQAVEQSQLSESADAPQGRLAGVAFMVGVNNMKRRRIRTTLTCVTIVLVTFTILSVISVRQDPEPLRLRIGALAPYDGFVFISPGMTPIEPARLNRMRAHFDEAAQTVARSWTARQDEFGAYMPFRITPLEPVPHVASTAFNASLILGLEPGERDFLADLESPEYLVPGSRWFSSPYAREIMLSRRSAALLGISPEDFEGRLLRLAGQDYELVGLYEDESFADLHDLRNLPFLPLKIDSTLVSEEEMNAEDADITQLPGVSTASPLEVAFLPIESARKLGNTTNRILSVQFRDPGDLPTLSARTWDSTQRFLRFHDAYLAVGMTEPVDRGEDHTALDSGQYAVASSTTAAVGGVLKVAIPVILAAIIILNTMLGAAMERKKEISIYNAIGLNPTHVMLFFLAEALVFGLVGSVAGYFIGQILSIGIGRFVDVNLNYSSLAVMVVIFLTIGTVMLSTVYPAALAARAAVPSGQRRWSVPTPDGDEIQLKFPFSYDSRRILGICAYLDEFMLQNSEASTGKFLSRLRAVGRVPTVDSPTGAQRQTGVGNGGNGETLALVYDIAPTPFDLGVNQKMEVYASYDTRVKAHMLSVHLTRESGDHDSWTTVNQPFLESLRKRLLGWRSQKPEVQEAFFERGRKLFHETPDLPVRDQS